MRVEGSLNPVPALTTGTGGMATGTTPQWLDQSPFRWIDDHLLVLDQSQLPWHLVERECRTPSDVADLIRQKAADGGPLLGQIAACGLALTATRLRQSSRLVWPDIIAAGAGALVAARPSNAYVRSAAAQIVERFRAGKVGTSEDALASALMEEAVAVVDAIAQSERLLAERVVALIESTSTSDVRLLVTGGLGHLGGTEQGLLVDVCRALVLADRQVHIFVPESRPYLDGSRITAWELERQGIPHTVLVDAAVGHLLASTQVDVVLLRADSVARNGDISAKVGSYGMALLAHRHQVPVYACAPGMAVDPSAHTGAEIPADTSSVEDTLRILGRAIASASTNAFTPLNDVVPAGFLTVFVTDGPPPGLDVTRPQTAT